MSEYIFITGDSFCASRKTNEDWPKVTANNLGLQLEGTGFSGMSWWPCKTLLDQYKNSTKFKNTEYFVIIHTGLNRPLGYTDFYNGGGWNPENDNYEEYKIYVKYFYNLDFHLWCTEQWCKELNQILLGKKVIHFKSFHAPENMFPNYFAVYNTLNGIIINETLLSYTDHQKFGFAKHFQYGRNHFSPEENKWFGNKVSELFNNYDSICQGQNVWYHMGYAK